MTKNAVKTFWIRHSTLIELWIGILLWSLVIQLILLLIPGAKGHNALGLWIGALSALLVAAHMEHSIGRALDAGEGGAPKLLIAAYLIRYFAMAAMLAALALTDVASPLAAFAGLMTLKLSAYLQPLTHRISERVCGKEVFEREMIPPEVQDEMFGKGRNPETEGSPEEQKADDIENQQQEG